MTTTSSSSTTSTDQEKAEVKPVVVVEETVVTTSTTTNTDDDDKEDKKEDDVDVVVKEPEPKKAKTTTMATETETETKTDADAAPLPMADYQDWPEAWLMSTDDDAISKDQKAPHRQDPNVPVSPKELEELGIQCWQMNADDDAYTYPTKAVPWDPKDAMDPRLVKLRDDRGYSYADIITVHPDHLPEYETKLKAFFEEHIHDAEEIRYILGGSGYFDVRNKLDQWVRIHVQKGHLITLPEGSYHRFTCDSKDIIHAMRLFIGQPVWTPFNRFGDGASGGDENESRIKYVQQYLKTEEKKEEE